jgi:hypothetical protein
MGMLSRPVLLGLPLGVPLCSIFASLASSPGPGLGSGLQRDPFPVPLHFVIPSLPDAPTTGGVFFFLPHKCLACYPLPVWEQILTCGPFFLHFKNKSVY